MEKDLHVSIAIPTFNSAEYVSELLDYATNQHPYRLYVLDDASTDETVSVCQQFPQAEVVAGDKNLGPTGNRNRVLSKDIGDVLVFLDDDMCWRSGDLLATVHKYFANIRLGALGFAIFDNSGKELWFGNERESNPLFFGQNGPSSNHCHLLNVLFPIYLFSGCLRVLSRSALMYLKIWVVLTNTSHAIKKVLTSVVGYG